MEADKNRVPWFFPCLLVHLLLSSSETSLCNGAEAGIISSGQSLSGEKTVSSKGGIFELGFFSPGKSHKRYLGIWYKQFPERTVVWVANRETPISNNHSSELRIGRDGNLIILNHLNRSVWSSDLPPIASNSTTAELLDTGNLVLRSGPSSSSTVLWESFDHPTDTWLPKGRVGRNKLTGERQRITPWKSSEDPSPGIFSLEMDPSGLTQFVLLWNRSLIYWKSGVWNGRYYSEIPGIGADQPYRMSLVETPNQTYATYEFLGGTLTRNVITPLGQVTQCTQMESPNSQKWNCFWAMPTSSCDIYSYCGSFGICSQPQADMALCTCLDGFEPTSPEDWNSRIWSRGCRRRTKLQCGTNISTATGRGDHGDGFLELNDVRLPVNPKPLKPIDEEGCRSFCLNNCTCTAYAYSNGCSLWTGDLINLRNLSTGDAAVGTLHLRLAATELRGLLQKNREKKKKNPSAVVLIAVAGGVLVLGAILLIVWIARRKGHLRRLSSLRLVQGSLVAFSYRDLQSITKNFSEKLGRGSFGSVFKGSLADSTVAVKKLEGLRQGEKQFRAEVSIIGTIQHINLIRLHGFCCQGSHRMLVYEYMPRGSLDSVLFSKSNGDGDGTVNWKQRFQIALGTARGLAYLHEGCRERIIHCDIKPENILLDSSFSPKVADFGMAKLLGREFSRVLTSMRGTVGYLAPEWISGLPITPKADVYSYGMMLFEIISGSRNSGGEAMFFPCWAACKISDAKFMDLLDHRLGGDADMEELARACRVACWCIQDSEDDRPSMGEVVKILEGTSEVGNPPIPQTLKVFM